LGTVIVNRTLCGCAFAACCGVTPDSVDGPDPPPQPARNAASAAAVTIVAMLFHVACS